MRSYWDERYKAEGMIWGEMPSKTAECAMELFGNEGLKTVLVPGSGYGRNTKLFSSSGFIVTGVEISEMAVRLAGEYDPLTTFYRGSVLDMSVGSSFDGIYCFNVLHLFTRKERMLFLNLCRRLLNDKGVAYFTVFSEMEPSFGTGMEIECNTFESKPGRPVHYFTEKDLLDHFSSFEVIRTGIINDAEDHGDGPHTHLLRFISVRKEERN